MVRWRLRATCLRNSEYGQTLSTYPSQFVGKLLPVRLQQPLSLQISQLWYYVTNEFIKKNHKNLFLIISTCDSDERKMLRKKKLEKNRENKGYRDRKRGRSGRAFSPPLSYPQMNLSCCLIMFLSFSPRGSQANFLHIASTELIGWYLGWPAVVCSEATGSLSSHAGNCSCFVLTYTTLHSCTHTLCVHAHKHARTPSSKWHTFSTVCVCVLFGVYVHVHVCVWPALRGISECYNMWACSSVPGQASELSETFETMVTTHLISALAKARTSRKEEGEQRE